LATIQEQQGNHDAMLKLREHARRHARDEL